MTAKLLSATEVADRLGCTAKTVRLKVQEGLLPAPVRFGPRGHLRFLPGEVEEFLATSLRGRPVDAASSGSSAPGVRRDPASTERNL